MKAKMRSDGSIESSGKTEFGFSILPNGKVMAKIEQKGVGMEIIMEAETAARIANILMATATQARHRASLAGSIH